MNHRMILHSSKKRSHLTPLRRGVVADRGVFVYPAIRQRGSALVISMFITVIILMIALYLLDKIVPTARDVRGIENGNKAYYSAETAMDEALLALSNMSPGSESWAVYTGSTSGGVWYQFQISASGTVIPTPGKGTSEYDPNWNRIGIGEPIQLSLPSGIDWTKVLFYVRVPNLSPTVTETLSGGTTTPAINWIISSGSGSLIASGSQIMASDVWTNGNTGTTIRFTDAAFKNGMTPEGSGGTVSIFYGSNCPTNNTCTLKLSLSTPLILTDPSIPLAPYLEYKLNMGATNPAIPLQYATITTKGYVSGFRKDATRSIRQQTTNEAADFTVFQ